MFRLQSLLQGFGELVGTGRGLAAALDAFEALDYVRRVHAFDEAADALQVAGTAADKADVFDDAAVQIKKDCLIHKFLLLYKIISKYAYCITVFLVSPWFHSTASRISQNP